MKPTIISLAGGVVWGVFTYPAVAQNAADIQEPPPSNISVLQYSVQAQQQLPQDRLVALPDATAPTATEQEIEHNALAEAERTGGTTHPNTSSVSHVSQPAEPSASKQVPAGSMSPKVQAMVDKYAHLADDTSAQAQAKVLATTPTQPAASAATAAPAPQKKSFDPNEYRPGVKWQPSSSTHFIIYTQQRSSGIGSSNMQMTFESAYATLRRNIPWMMSAKVRAFVYQDHDNYLRYEPKAKGWTRALAYPTRGEIVVYDEPGKQKELQEVFTHELTHIFTQQFFGKQHPDKLMTPTWLDEGLAVYMEDQAYNGSQGGPWAQDLRKLNLRPSKRTSSSVTTWGSSNTSSPRRRKGRTVFLMPFDQFTREGSLEALEKQGKTQDWYLQAYAMVRFLLNPGGGSSPSNRMQFEQFTKLLSEGQLQRDPVSGYPLKDARGNAVYKPYTLEQALNKAYYYNNMAAFEDKFWQWINSQK